jgi:rhamnogalacturonan endolyase
MSSAPLLLAVVGVSLALGATPAPGAGDSVLLSEEPGTVHVANREVALSFDRVTGTLVSLVFRGRELLGGGGQGYVQIAADRSYGTVQWTYRLVRHEPDLVEIAFVSVAPAFPFDIETHYVLRAGDPGFYNYIVMGHDAEKHPGIFGLAQLDFALRVDPRLFTVAAVDDRRIAPLPRPETLRQSPLVMDATFRLPDGRIYSKYFQSAAMDERHTVHGLVGPGVGIWIVMPSHEHLNGGPEHQELTVHQTDTTPVLLAHYTGAHYGAGTISSDSREGSWSKASAPWFVYLNAGRGARALWRDARRRAAREVAAWPFGWLEDARFELHRAVVSGRIVLDGGRPGAGARVILARHEDPPPALGWQQQWRGYRFYGWAGADGRFTVRKVRHGTYDVWAWKRGIVGSFVVPAIAVGAGERVELGDLAWQLPRGRELLWQIGRPDRSAAEFGFAQHFRRWGLWNAIAARHPAGVKFSIGASPLRALPYEMAVTQGPDASWRLPVWRIAFGNTTPRAGKAILTLAFAEAESNVAASAPRIDVSLNGEILGEVDSLVHDGAAHRSAVYGLYQERVMTFDAARLRRGRNTLTFAILAPRGPVSRVLGYPGAAAMFDCLRLEVQR